MAYFQSQNGFVHLVFANQQDRYFLPGLLQLELNSFLYYLLKKQGYRSVFFISEAEGKFHLRFYDEPSQEAYLNTQKGLLRLFSQKAADANTYICKNADECARQLTALLEKSRNLALVFRLDTFSRIFCAAGNSRLQAFSLTGQRNLEQSGNIVLLQLPMTASGSQAQLTEQSGVFSSAVSPPLCREISELQEKPHNGNLYDMLARNLGERCVFLSSFSRENLLPAAKYICLTEEEPHSWDTASFTELADFLYAWYHSARLRRDTGPLLSPNDTRVFSDLLRDLRDKKKRQSVRSWIEHTKSAHKGESLRRILDRLYPEDVFRTRIRSDSRIAVKLQKLLASLPPQALAGSETFPALVEDYQIPQNQVCGKALEDNLLLCFSFLENAAAKEDPATFAQAEKILRYYYDRGFRFGQEEDRKIWKCQETVLSLSEHIFLLDQLIQEDIKNIEKYQQEKNALMEYIDRQLPLMPPSVPGIVSARELEMSNKKQELLNASQQADNLSYMKGLKEAARNQNQQALKNLELTIGNLRLGSKLNVEQVIHDAMDMLTRQTLENRQAEAFLEDYSKNLSYLLQEQSAEDTPEPFLPDYKSLL